MKNILLMMGALLTMFPTYAISANAKQNAEIDRASDQAWNFYQEKKYNEARIIVNKFYVKEHVSLALLSGLLYAGENKCKEALGAIDYVSVYYDNDGINGLARKSDATDDKKKTESDIKNAFLGIKKVGFVCHMQLEQWQEAIHDAKLFLQFKPDDLMALLALGNSSKQLARINISVAEEAFEQVSKFPENNANNEIKSDGNDNLSASDFARFNLAVLYSWEGQHEKAVKAASQLLKETKTQQKILDGMKGSPDYSLILKDKDMIAVIKSLGLKQ